MFHNIRTPFEISSNSFHKIAFIYKSKMDYCGNGFDLRNETLFS